MAVGIGAKEIDLERCATYERFCTAWLNLRRPELDGGDSAIGLGRVDVSTPGHARSDNAVVNTQND